MKRADRLYALMTALRDGKLHTAEALSQDLGVSVRTIYRDMEVLAASGVPVAGTRGLGFTVSDAITLPPLNLTETEVRALHASLGALAASDLGTLSEAAGSLASKIDSVLPVDGAPAAFGFAIDAFANAPRGFGHIKIIRSAIEARQKLRLATIEKSYVLRPLHLDYWGRVWSVLGWCEFEAGFVTLALDRITQVNVLPGLFVDEPGKRFSDWQAQQ